MQIRQSNIYANDAGPLDVVTTIKYVRPMPLPAQLLCRQGSACTRIAHPVAASSNETLITNCIYSCSATISVWHASFKIFNKVSACMECTPTTCKPGKPTCKNRRGKPPSKPTGILIGLGRSEFPDYRCPLPYSSPAAICRISSALRSPASGVLGIRYFPIASPPITTGS